MRKGHVEDTIDSRIAAIQKQIDEHQQRVAELNAAMGQLAVLRDEMFEGEGANDDE